MAYQAEISRVNPTCFLFLVDQSSSMLEPIMGVAGNPRKAEFVADALNKTISNLVVTASKDVDVWRYYQIGVIGYGKTVEPILGGNLAGKNLVWIDEVYANPLRIEERTAKESDGAGGVIEIQTKFPVWFEPVANGQTPMCQALELANEIVAKWVLDYKLSYPPTIINLTDGEANDGDPRVPAKMLQSLATTDGKSMLMTLHVSSNPFAKQVFFPNTPESLPDDASRLMFEMSSVLPPTNKMKATAEAWNVALLEGAKAIVYNAGIDAIVKALDIGTRAANMR